MRAIDTTLVNANIPNAWLQKAEAKKADLQNKYAAIMAQRGTGQALGQESWRKDLSEAVTGLESVWQDKALKKILMDASFGKCWYCEARVAERADNAIDHFRPKNRVAEDRTHPGYWWLACDWRNYRFACQFCNSARVTDTAGGKQDHFPLWDESKRVRTEGVPLGIEQPLLLDPTKSGDMLYLTFERTGKPAPRYGKDEQAYHHSRADASIRHYHLDRGELNKNRRDLMAEIEGHLNSAEEFSRELGGNNPTAEAAYNREFETLLQYIRPYAEFSGAARAFLAANRGRYTVAIQVLDASL